MPNYDQTGPCGTGPTTGRGGGSCACANRGGAGSLFDMASASASTWLDLGTALMGEIDDDLGAAGSILGNFGDAMLPTPAQDAEAVSTEQEAAYNLDTIKNYAKALAPYQAQDLKTYTSNRVAKAQKAYDKVAELLDAIRIGASFDIEKDLTSMDSLKNNLVGVAQMLKDELAAARSTVKGTPAGTGDSEDGGGWVLPLLAAAMFLL